MRTSIAYGLIIQSELQLLENITTDKQADVVVSFGDLANYNRTETNRGSCILGELPGAGNFLIRNGNEIIVDPVSSADESLLRSCILGSAMAVILRQRGLFVLHASCIATNDGAVAFMGNSGWGKSTLASAFHAKGYSILTDDVMAMEMTAENCMVAPSFPSVKILPDSAASIGYAFEGLPLVHSQTNKRIHQLDNGFMQTPYPLKRIYVLGKGSQNEILPLPYQKAFLELVHHSRAVKALTDSEFIRTHFQQCSQLLKNVSVCYLQREWSLNALTNLVELIEQDIAENI